MKRLLMVLRRPRAVDQQTVWNSKAGNIALITALMMIPITFALGMAFDFTLAQSRTDQIDGMADVAALGGVTPTMMGKSNVAAAAAANALFLSQVNTISGVGYSVNNVSVVANDTATGASVSRILTITYKATSTNVFAKLLGMDTFPINGFSQAKSSTAPNIDFYLMLDTSPSMEIAATSAGITQMTSNTSNQEGGCAFGCHETSPSSDSLTYSGGIKCTDGTTFATSGKDNYALSRCLGVTLRIDLLNQAAQNLMTVAQQTEAQDNAAYRMALYVTDYNGNSLTSPKQLQALTSDFTAAKSAAAGVVPLAMYSNNHLTSGDSNQDEDTYLDSQLGVMNQKTTIPDPGTGTNNKGDTPQEVLFIVTDGLNDEAVGGSRKYLPMDQNGALCTAIKARNIRIAVLYTTYEPMTGESWYDTYISPLQKSGNDQMATAAQACASSGLYYEVSTNGDVSAALVSLFQEAVATAHLTQ